MAALPAARKARALLRQGKSIAEAALAVGYADQSHFHRIKSLFRHAGLLSAGTVTFVQYAQIKKGELSARRPPMSVSLSTLIPAAFPALALAHFLALLSPGPDFFSFSVSRRAPPLARGAVYLPRHSLGQRPVHLPCGFWLVGHAANSLAVPLCGAGRRWLSCLAWLFAAARRAATQQRERAALPRVRPALSPPAAS